MHAHNFADGIVEICDRYRFAFSADGKHPGFHRNSFNIGAASSISELCNLLSISFLDSVHPCRVDLDNFNTSFVGREWDIYKAIKASRPKQSRIKYVAPISSPDDLDFAPVFKSIHFGKELHKGPLHFTVSRSCAI